jgi:hypothetical protein
LLELVEDLACMRGQYLAGHGGYNAAGATLEQQDPVGFLEATDAGADSGQRQVAAPGRAGHAAGLANVQKDPQVRPVKAHRAIIETAPESGSIND